MFQVEEGTYDDKEGWSKETCKPQIRFQRPKLKTQIQEFLFNLKIKSGIDQFLNNYMYHEKGSNCLKS